MRKLVVLCGLFLCLSISAVAQDAAPAFDADSSPSSTATPAMFSVSDRQPWQVAIGYQYQHYNSLGQSIHTNGFNSDVTRYLSNWFGIEGNLGLGYGHTGSPLNLSAKTVFFAAGPHIAVHNNSRFEPWVHFLAGGQHFRFTQTGGDPVLGSNTGFAFMGGVGADYKLGDRVSWRVQGDYVGNRFNSQWDGGYSFGTGVVFNF